MIFGLDGLPEPPSDIVRRLQEVDPRLGMRFIVGGEGLPNCWAITIKWPPDDRRRSSILKGEWSPDEDNDAICFLPADCSPHEAVGYFTNSVRRSSSEDVRGLMDRLHMLNTKQREDNWAPAMDSAMEKAEGNASTLFAKEKGVNPRSYGGLEKPKKTRRKR